MNISQLEALDCPRVFGHIREQEKFIGLSTLPCPHYVSLGLRVVGCALDECGIPLIADVIEDLAAFLCMCKLRQG